MIDWVIVYCGSSRQALIGAGRRGKILLWPVDDGAGDMEGQYVLRATSKAPPTSYLFGDRPECAQEEIFILYGAEAGIFQYLWQRAKEQCHSMMKKSLKIKDIVFTFSDNRHMFVAGAIT